MKNKKILLFGMIFLFGIIILSMTSFVKASANYCCQKTTSGALCRNAPQASCDTSNGLQAQPTSCNQTSYCQIGTCVDTTQGMCLPNTPKSVCENNGGYWTLNSTSQIPQCSYGCCLYGDQSSLVTQTRCSTIGSMTGQNVTYRPDITDELTCLASAASPEKGACVYTESSGVKSCKLTDQEGCNKLKSVSGYSKVNFNVGYLCSAAFLGTICGPRGGTTCVPDSSQVYFKDTCGNLANVYDASKLNDEQYWTKIIDPTDSCGADSVNGNANSATCGNCNYLAGSICKPYVRGENVKPSYGDNICQDLGCHTGELAQEFKKEYGRDPYHGESWCALSNKAGVKGFGVGTESYVLSCYDGEVIQEGCSVGNHRSLVCKSDVTNGVSSAACIVNLWQDCEGQTTEAACTDASKRDCKWIEGYSITGNATDANGNSIQASCVPKYPPATNFWDGSQNTTANLCSIGNSISVVQYSVAVLQDIKNHDDNNFASRLYRITHWKKKGESYSPIDASGTEYANWIGTKNSICSALGDCSASANYQGVGSDTPPANLTLYKFFRRVKDAIKSVNN